MWPDGPKRVAEFTYGELCERPIGTYDYIALCEQFDVIVLTGVPKFASTDENAARRFASFVDILYDRHKKLVCTTDAPPKELFKSIKSHYSDGTDDDEMKTDVRMPTDSSSKHVTQFRIPKAVSCIESGGYRLSQSEGPKKELGCMEWSATGLKDASLFGLTCNSQSQQYDRLLPIIRCESRLEELSYLSSLTSLTSLTS